MSDRHDTVVFVHDPEVDLLSRHLVPMLVEHYRLGDTGLEVRPFSNRNELLAAIDAEQRPSIALIDLQHDDRRDLNYSGHRVIETIRRHQRLWERCRPAAFTVHARLKLYELAHDHGAFAFVCRNRLERGDVVDLGGQLRAQASRSAAGFGRIVDCEIVPRGYEVVDPPEDPDRVRQEVARVFTRRSDLNPKQWTILRYAAEGLGVRAIGDLLDGEFDVKGVRAVERLQAQLRPAYRVHGPDLKEAAQDLFRVLPEKADPPTPELSFQLLAQLRALDAAIVPARMREGYLDDRARDTFWAVHGRAWPVVAQLPGNAAHQQHLAPIRAALEELVASEPEDRRQASLRARSAEMVRAVHNIVDTDAAASTGIA